MYTFGRTSQKGNCIQFIGTEEVLLITLINNDDPACTHICTNKNLLNVTSPDNSISDFKAMQAYPIFIQLFLFIIEIGSTTDAILVIFPYKFCKNLNYRCQMQKR